MSELISVVIPTHNSVEFIGKTLESVFKQTLLPSEVVIVDDASTDGTNDLVASIAQQAPVPVRLHRLPTNSGGSARPLNVGIGLASGPLIATLDHDDLMLPEKLELQATCFNQDAKLGLVLSNFYFYLDNTRHDVAPLELLRELVGAIATPLGKECYRIAARDFYRALVEKSIAGSCSNFLFAKQVWADCGGFDEQLMTCCDYGFIQAVAKGCDIGIVNRTLFFYNWLDESLYRTTDRLIHRRDRLRVFRRFEPTLLNTDTQSKLQRRVMNELLGGAHLLREQGAYGKSLTFYLESIYRGGLTGTAVLGIAKLIPHKIMHTRAATERPIEGRL